MTALVVISLYGVAVLMCAVAGKKLANWDPPGGDP